MAKRAAKSEAVATQPAHDAIVRANAVAREVVQSPSFVSLYTNDTQIQISPWDVRLQFGEIEEIDPEVPRVRIKRTGEVRMSPQHAKRIVMILIQQLKNYELTIGPIPLPKE